jgi:cysteine desulfurase
MTTIYLDNNATTRLYPQVVQAIQPWLYEYYGNPSSSHSLGQQAKQALIQARAEVAKFLTASPAEIIFTSGATESNHMAIQCAIAAMPQRNTIVTSSVEHPSSLELFEHLAEQGLNIVYIPVNANGELDMLALKAAVNADTALVSLMHANNETGVIFPIAEAAAIAHSQGALFHTDAAQTAGKLALKVKELDCDMLSFSAHKLHAPKGVGVLYLRKNLSVQPLFYGHQERKRRGGTENLTGIIGLGVACQAALAQQSEAASYISGLRDRLQAGILKQLPYAKLNGIGLKVPNTCNITFLGISAEELLYKLDKIGIIASQGSACVAGGTDPSHVLTAMGLSRDEALSAVRFSLSELTTAAEIETAIASIVAVAHEITDTAALVA